MRILAVCGLGIGTSILLKMNVISALAQLGMDAAVEATSIETAKGCAATADLVLTSAQFVAQFEGLAPARAISNFMDAEEIAAAISDATSTSFFPVDGTVAGGTPQKGD